MQLFVDVVEEKSKKHQKKDLSQKISNLEKSIGVELISGNNSNWSLTAEGKNFFEGSKKMIDESR